MNLEFGNAWENCETAEDGNKHGWIVGDANVVSKPGLRQRDNPKIKWFHHPKGHESGQKPPSEGMTISFLIEGRFAIWFRQGAGEWEQFLLSRRGDYVIWGEGLDHKWQALEDSIVLTVRWC